MLKHWEKIKSDFFHNLYIVFPLLFPHQEGFFVEYGGVSLCRNVFKTHLHNNCGQCRAKARNRHCRCNCRWSRKWGCCKHEGYRQHSIAPFKLDGWKFIAAKIGFFPHFPIFSLSLPQISRPCNSRKTKRTSYNAASPNPKWPSSNLEGHFSKFCDFRQF